MGRLTFSTVVASLILSSSIVMAETVVDDNQTVVGNQKVQGDFTLEKRMYQHDGFGAQWAFDVGSAGLWFVNKEPVDGEYSAALKIDNNATANALVIGSSVEGKEGYIGIGTDVPDEALHIESTNKPIISLLKTYSNSNVDKPVFMLMRARTEGNKAVKSGDVLGKFVFKGHDGDDSTFKDNVAGTFTVTATEDWSSSGHGTSFQLRQAQPGSTRTVVGLEIKGKSDVYIPNGNLYVKGTKMAVPDYVFADNYKLMPLNNLKQYIDKNDHLPGITSADEVGKAGVVNLSGLQMNLLEKVEELTLYTLQQEEKISKLEKNQEEVKALKDRLTLLESLLSNLAFNIDNKKEKLSLK